MLPARLGGFPCAALPSRPPPRARVPRVSVPLARRIDRGAATVAHSAHAFFASPRHTACRFHWHRCEARQNVVRQPADEEAQGGRWHHHAADAEPEPGEHRREASRAGGEEGARQGQGVSMADYHSARTEAHCTMTRTSRGAPHTRSILSPLQLTLESFTYTRARVLWRWFRVPQRRHRALTCMHAMGGVSRKGHRNVTPSPARRASAYVRTADRCATFNTASQDSSSSRAIDTSSISRDLVRQRRGDGFALIETVVRMARSMDAIFVYSSVFGAVPNHQGRREAWRPVVSIQALPSRSGSPGV